jgi:hypothetical protein
VIQGNGFANVIGTRDNKVVMMGRTTTETNGGYQDLFVLLKLNADMGMNCLRATSGAYTLDQPLTAPPVAGCSSLDEPLTDATFPVVMSTVAFSTRDLCATLTGVGEHGDDQDLRVFPNPVAAGASLNVDVSAVKDLARVECIGADGRMIRNVLPVKGAQRITMDTKGLLPGLYLIRTVDGSGRTGMTARVVVE